MALMRSGYRTELVPWRNGGPSVTIRWYRAPAGAKHFPFPHIFNPLGWDYAPWELGAPGEVYGATKTWFNGATPPSATGQNFVGSPYDFLHGAEYSPLLPILPRDPWGLISACTGITWNLGGEAEGGELLGALEGGEAEGGELLIRLIGGEAEGGDLNSLNYLRGSEAEGGITYAGAVMLGGEAEGGDGELSFLRGGEAEGGWTTRDIPLRGGEAEGGITYAGAVMLGGEAEGAGAVSVAILPSGGEAEGGDAVLSTLEGGEAEGGDAVLSTLEGGEAEGGDMPVLFGTAGGGELEGGGLFLRSGYVALGGEAEGGSYGPALEGGEAEGGDLPRIHTVYLEGGEAEGYYDLVADITPNLWLDSSDLGLTQGAAVSLWPDKSGNGNDATQPTALNQPIYDPAGSGKAGGVLFAASQYMLLTSPVNSGPPWTVYCVVRPNAPTGMRGAALTSATSPFGIESRGVMVVDPFNLPNGSAAVGADGAFFGLPWPWGIFPHTIIAAKRVVNNVWITGNELFVNVTPFTGVSPGYTIDYVGGYTFGTPLTGWVFEILVYERELTDTEDDLVQSYLSAKWGIPL